MASDSDRSRDDDMKIGNGSESSFGSQLKHFVVSNSFPNQGLWFLIFP